MTAPTISALVRVFNAEPYIAETLTAVLSQTRPPDEIVVVDDGSTDGTPAELERFGGEIRVVRQANGGYSAAYNRGFAEVKGDYVANCDADDIWEPDKLQRQAEALLAHPEIEIAFGAARFFGLREGPFNAFSGAGLMEPRSFARQLYRADPVCASSALISRRLQQRVGPFREEAAPCEDYDYWLRALAAGATFFYDPRLLVRYRAHPQQVSRKMLRMHEREHAIHGWHADLVGDRRLVRGAEARDLSNIARELSDLGETRAARAAFLSSFRRRPTPRVLAWAALLSIPKRYGHPLANGLVSIKRGLIPRAR